MRGRSILKNIDIWKVKKTGFTVVEVLAYIAISTIVIGLMMSLFFSLLKSSENLVKENRNLNRVESSIINIWGIVKDEEISKITIKNNEIQLFIKSVDRYGNIEQKGKIILLQNDQIRVNNYKFEYGSWNKINYNLILDEVEEFKVWRNNKILYISVKRGGEEYIKSF